MYKAYNVGPDFSSYIMASSKNLVETSNLPWLIKGYMVIQRGLSFFNKEWYYQKQETSYMWAFPVWTQTNPFIQNASN